MMIKKAIIALSVLLFLLICVSSYYINRYYAHQVFLKEQSYICRNSLAVISINDEDAAVKYAKIILEHKLARDVDINNMSAKLYDEENLMGGWWEVKLLDEMGEVIIHFNRSDAEVTAINVVGS